jgi:pyruvate kinase
VNIEPLMSSRTKIARASLSAIARQLVRLEGSLLDLEKTMRPAIARAASDRRESAKNLVHYIALRQHDLRDLQLQLSQRGLSSLGRAESCILGSVIEVSERVHESLALRADRSPKRQLRRLEKARRSAMSWDTAQNYLHKHTHDILGARPDNRHIYIMVTAPSAKEADLAWMAKMLRAGMNVLRINCAHEGEREWGLVVRALREARTESGKECRILMDLAGPKIRTGSIIGTRHIATWKVIKDDIGRVTAPTRVVIRRASAPPADEGGPFLFVSDEALAEARVGDEVRFRDARGKKRALQLHEAGPDGLVGLATKRAYVVDRASARLYRRGLVGNLMIEVGNREGAAIDVKTGDSLLLTRKATGGRPPRRDRKGRIQKPGIIGCTLPAALDHLEVGHGVLLDDGRIHAQVERALKRRSQFLLRVIRTQKESIKLRAEKGINLPDTLIAVPCLTEEDHRALRFVAKHADAVSLSFVRTPDDVRKLHAELDRLGRCDIGVVLKIETRAGFENLPRLLLEGLRRSPLAVMIARGDLAVEVGFERLAELQEEILWLCEAAHVPTIWATQVLDTLARTGVPSRAEVTDAAASVAAECVMLNKGPFVDEAVSVLSDILRRMEKHHYKKRSLFRKLRVSTFAESRSESLLRAALKEKKPLQ